MGFSCRGGQGAAVAAALGESQSPRGDTGAVSVSSHLSHSREDRDGRVNRAAEGEQAESQ